MKFICNQSWEDMAPAEQGRFCGLCQKKVYDFTGIPVDEVLKLKSSSGEELCGRFTAMQVYPDIIAPIRISRFVRATALLSTLLLLSSRPSGAQSRDTVKTEQHIDCKQAGSAEASVQNKNEDAPTSVDDKKSERKKTITLFRIGQRRFFLSRTFPFIHSRRWILTGRFL